MTAVSKSVYCSRTGFAQDGYKNQASVNSQAESTNPSNSPSLTANKDGDNACTAYTIGLTSVLFL